MAIFSKRIFLFDRLNSHVFVFFLSDNAKKKKQTIDFRYRPSVDMIVFIPSVTDVFSWLCILCKQVSTMQTSYSKCSTRQAIDKAQKILVLTDLA